MMLHINVVVVASLLPIEVTTVYIWTGPLCVSTHLVSLGFMNKDGVTADLLSKLYRHGTTRTVLCVCNIDLLVLNFQMPLQSLLLLLIGDDRGWSESF